MGAVPSAVPKAVPASVASSTVPVNSKAQRGPYRPMTGKSVVPAVPRTDPPDPEMATQPAYGTTGASGRPPASGSAGAPSVPVDGFLFKRGPADAHYLVADEGGRDPYARVNNPPTRGMLTWVKAYVNGIWQGKQNVDSAGWQQRAPQQRTSWMRITPPPHGGGYAPETYDPRQLPQADNTYKFNPVLGNDQPGPRILNRTTYGAGQTAGGQGGNTYTPSPGPPDTTSTASQPPQGGGMPVWG